MRLKRWKERHRQLERQTARRQISSITFPSHATPEPYRIHSRLLSTLHMRHTGFKFSKFSPSTARPPLHTNTAAHIHLHAGKPLNTNQPLLPTQSSYSSSIPHTFKSLQLGKGTPRAARGGPSCKHSRTNYHYSLVEMFPAQLLRTLDLTQFPP